MARLLRSREPALRVGGSEAGRLAGRLGAKDDKETVLLLPMRVRESVRHVLVLADAEGRDFSGLELEVARAFAAAAAAGLAQLRLADEHATQIARRPRSPARRKTLNESLDLNRVLVPHLPRGRQHPRRPTYAVVYLGDAAGRAGDRGHLRHAAGGDRLPHAAPASGWRARSHRAGPPLLTNDYQALPDQPAPIAVRRRCAAALAVPMHWDGELRGVLAVGYRRATRHAATS